MLRTDLPDHRRATEDDLVAALRSRDPLALAEAYHRTIPAAHAAARRLLSGSAEVEALLRQVYTELWADPPQGVALEGWVRGRCFAIAVDDLRERDAAPASPSLTALLPELPKPEVRYLDAAERALAELDPDPRRTLLMAHDRGIPTTEHGDPDADAALVEALLALAGPEAGSEPLDPGVCADIPGVGDWILGLVSSRDAARISEQVAADPACAALAKALRRGRRRLEGLPPTPDMGQRVLVVVLAGAPSPARSQAAAVGIPSALDAGTGPLPRVTDPAAAQTAALAPNVVADDFDTEDRADDTGPVGPTGIYAELAELDQADPAVDPVPAPVAVTDDLDASEEHLPPRRSLGRRMLVWLLGALFMFAGVAAGLYLGLTLLS